MTTIIDLDEVLGKPKHVKLAGQKYELPPDLPVELYLKIQTYSDGDRDERDVIAELYEDVLGLFRWRKPDLQSLPITLPQLIVAIGRIYGSGEGDGSPPPPPRKRPAGTASTRTRKPTRSRS